MTTHTYTPGHAVGVVAAGVAVLVDLPATDPLAGELLTALTEEPSIEAVIDVLLSHGLRKLGSFAAASLEPDGVRVVVRGDFTALAPGEEPIVASGLWTDRTLPGADAVTLTARKLDAVPLPIVQGVVLADSIRLGVPADVMPEVAGPEAAVAVEEVPSAPEPSAPEPIEPEPPAPIEPEPSAPIEPEPVRQPPVEVAAPVATDVGPGPGLLIESFPWADAPAPQSPVVTPAPVVTPDPLAIPDPVATPEVFAAPASPAWSEGFDGESVEMTVDRSRLIGYANGGAPAVLVVAARCPSGHLSPAYAEGCRVCHQPLPPQQPTEVPRPQLGVLRLSNGDTVALDRGVVLGRNPHLPMGYVGEQPNLVRLSDPGKDISSQHLEVTLDYWHVLVTDLGSTNGTEVILPGQAAIRLQPNDPMTIEPGARVVLAGVFDFVYEVTG